MHRIGKVLFSILLIISCMTSFEVVAAPAKNEPLWERLYVDAMMAWSRKEYAITERLLLDSMDVAHGNIDNLIATLEALETFYDDLAEYDAEEQVIQAQLDLLRNCRPYPTECLGATYLKFGAFHSSQDRFIDAIKDYTVALPLLRASTGKDSLEVGLTLNNLAWAEHKIGNWQKSEKHFRHSLSIFAKTAGEKSLYYGLTSANLAEVYVCLLRRAPALEAYKKALAAFEASLGEDDPMTLSVNSRYADLLNGPLKRNDNPNFKIAPKNRPSADANFFWQKMAISLGN